MTTIGTLLNDVREELLGVHRAEYDILGAAISSTSATSITVTDDAAGIVKGAIIAIEDELLLCRSKPDATHVVTVVRGFLGSTAATHSNGTLIEVQPRFPMRTLRRMMVDEVRSWQPRLFKVAETDLTLADDVRGYDVGASYATAYGVLAATLQPDPDYWATAPLSWPKVDVRFDPNANTTDFTNGTAVVLPEFYSNLSDRLLHVVFAMPFTLSTVTDATDLQSTVGLQDSMDDLLRYGIMWRAMAGREVNRVDIHAQGTSREAEEVQAGATLQTALQLKRLRDTRLAEEINNLRTRYGGW